MAMDIFIQKVEVVNGVEEVKYEKLSDNPGLFSEQMSTHKKSINKTANYTVESTISMVFCETTGGDVAITLPAASAFPDRVIEMVKTDSSANKVTCVGQEATTQYASLKFESNGTNWIPLL